MKFDPGNLKEVAKLKQVHAIGEHEKIIDVVYRHTAYLIIMFSSVLLIFALILAVGYILLPTLVEDNTTAYNTMTLIAIIMAALMVLVFVIANYLYLQTKLIITNENLVQVIQTDLLHSKRSRIALTDIEGVYADQSGYFATIFGYGKLTVETKGEQVNFVFKYCPRHGKVAKELIDAKERLITGVETYSQD